MGTAVDQSCTRLRSHIYSLFKALSSHIQSLTLTFSVRFPCSTFHVPCPALYLSARVLKEYIFGDKAKGVKGIKQALECKYVKVFPGNGYSRSPGCSNKPGDTSIKCSDYKTKMNGASSHSHACREFGCEWISRDIVEEGGARMAVGQAHASVGELLWNKGNDPPTAFPIKSVLIPKGCKVAIEVEHANQPGGQGKGWYVTSTEKDAETGKELEIKGWKKLEKEYRGGIAEICGVFGKITSLVVEDTGEDKGELHKKANLFIYAMDATTTRIRNDDVRQFQIFTKYFGFEMWSKTIIGLTKANRLTPYVKGGSFLLSYITCSIFVNRSIFFNALEVHLSTDTSLITPTRYCTHDGSMDTSTVAYATSIYDEKVKGITKLLKQVITKQSGDAALADTFVNKMWASGGKGNRRILAAGMSQPGPAIECPSQHEPECDLNAAREIDQGDAHSQKRDDRVAEILENYQRGGKCHYCRMWPGKAGAQEGEDFVDNSMIKTFLPPSSSNANDKKRIRIVQRRVQDGEEEAKMFYVVDAAAPSIGKDGGFPYTACRERIEPYLMAEQPLGIRHKGHTSDPVGEMWLFDLWAQTANVRWQF